MSVSKKNVLIGVGAAGLSAAVVLAVLAIFSAPKTLYLGEVVVYAPTGEAHYIIPILPASGKSLNNCKAVVAQSMMEHQDAVIEYLQAGATVKAYCLPVNKDFLTLTPDDAKASPAPPAKDDAPVAPSKST